MVGGDEPGGAAGGEKELNRKERKERRGGMRARTGKIARLPAAAREELNRRLVENEPASKILPWLNGLPEMGVIIAEMGEAGGHQVGPVDDRNLSEWRKGGFADWLRRRERIEETRELARWSTQMAKAGGGDISEGAAAILSGQILEVLEGLTELRESGGDAAAVAKAVEQVTVALSRVRRGDHDRRKLELDRERLGQGAEALELERQKFQRTTCELFLKWYEDKRALEAASSGDNAERIEKLGQLMFGEDFKN